MYNTDAPQKRKPRRHKSLSSLYSHSVNVGTVAFRVMPGGSHKKITLLSLGSKSDFFNMSALAWPFFSDQNPRIP